MSDSIIVGILLLLAVLLGASISVIWMSDYIDKKQKEIRSLNRKIRRLYDKIDSQNELNDTMLRYIADMESKFEQKEVEA